MWNFHTWHFSFKNFAVFCSNTGITPIIIGIDKVFFDFFIFLISKQSCVIMNFAPASIFLFLRYFIFYKNCINIHTSASKTINIFSFIQVANKLH
ncbi:MAG: hypothetical protein B6U87_01090 [Candidatus Aenigmarchaeota archaeon ex4484_52]|nr:MAG: hypothetical protein B6U87_01090 [Candidatus Aenigmarchaeota archaeon ex4484_52]